MVAVGASAAYYSQIFGSSKVSSNSQTENMQIIGGVGVGTVDTYTPDNFTVKEGQNVTLVILNTDDNTHGLVLTQFGVNTGIIPPGDTQRVSFIANQTGIFKFYEPPGYCKGGFGGVCNSVQHMWGYVTVTSP
jgi:nitrous oxide reductase